MRNDPTLPTSKSPPESFNAAVMAWTGNRLSPHSDFYAGRGPKRGDLNEDHLEMLFQGIKRDFSPEHAERFVKFVQALTDFGATAFLVAFQQFWDSGCADSKCYRQRKVDGYVPTSHNDEEKLIIGMISILGAMSDHRSQEMLDFESDQIKWAFLTLHGKKGPRRSFTTTDCGWQRYE